MRVVVADDDPIIRQLFVGRLAQMGCEALIAEDGAKAWKILRGARPVDLAIVDLDMPNVDGFSLIQCVRGHPRTRHLPIIVVTSRSDTAAIQEAFASGATSFLTKPVNWSTFGSHIDYLLRLTQGAHQSRTRAERAEAAIRIKDLVLRRTLDCGLKGGEAICDGLVRLRENLAAGRPASELAAEITGLEQRIATIQSVLTQAQSMTRSLCANVRGTEARVPLINILANAQTRVQERSQERNVPVFVVRMPEGAYVACDPEGISSAIAHLLDNAICFSPQGEGVTLEADVHPDGMLTVTVTDNGPGMDPDFYAARLNPMTDHETAEQTEADGVGLPLVKAIAQAHGGVLEIRSMPNQGTSAMLVIPADRVYLETDAAA